MSLNAKLDARRRAASWAERKEYGRASDRPEDVWAYTRLLRTGCISAVEHDAVIRLSRLWERSRPGGAVGGYERVQGGLSDPHARLFDAAVCGRLAENATHAVARRLRAKQAAVFWAAFDFPHKSVADLAEVYAPRDEFGVRVSHNAAQRVRTILMEGAELLAAYFDGVDGDQKNYGAPLAFVGERQHQNIKM